MISLPTNEHVGITPRERFTPLVSPKGLKQLPKGFMAEFVDENDDPLYFVKDFMENVSYFIV